VTFVAFSPDGAGVLTGSYDGTAKLWSAETGEAVRSFGGGAGMTWVLSAGFSADGTRVTAWLGGITSNDGTTKLWDAATGELLQTRTFAGHADHVSSAAFSPDNTKILTTSNDRTAKVWDAATGAVLRTFTGHKDDVYAGAFSPDGTRAVTGSYDGTARRWSVSDTIHGGIVINNNRSATNNPSVTLALTWSGGAGTGVVRMRFSNDGATWSAWEPLMPARPYTLPPGSDGHRTVRVQYLDKMNNRSDVFKDYIRLDTTPPTGSITINGGAMTTTTQAVTLGLAWADGDGAQVSRMRFSDNGSNWTPWEPPASTRAHTLPKTEPGHQTVRVQYLDGAGNYSAVCNDYIKLVAP
jgi:WD40 repeat protein